MTRPSFPARALIKLFLLSFPLRYRSRLGSEIRQFIQDDYEEAVIRLGRSSFSFWTKTFWGLVANGIGARFDSLGAGRRSPDPARPNQAIPSSGGSGAGETVRTLRHSFRSLGRNPGFTLSSLLTLGLGVGACTVIFSVVYPILIAPLPYPESEQLVVLNERSPGPDGRGGWVSPLTFRDWREGREVFEDIVSYRLDILTWTGGEGPSLIKGWAVSAGFFPLMGMNMTLGRGFTEEEDQPGGERVMVLSHGFWARSFGSDPDILGQSMTLDGAPYTIVGVAGPDLDFPSRGDYWHPAATDYSQEFRDFRYLGVLGRIRAGSGPQEAQAELDRISLSVESQNPTTNAGWSAELESLREVQVGQIRPVLLGMVVAVVLLLLIAVGNLTNLTIARGAGRRTEAAIRRALGASQTTMARLHLSESILLSIAGSALGLALAFLALRFLSSTNLLSLPRVTGVSLDARSVVFAVGASLLVGLVLGEVAILVSAGGGLSETLRAGGAGGMATSRTHRVREVVLASQMALALTLLIGASLLTRSLIGLSQVDTGLTPIIS